MATIDQGDSGTTFSKGLVKAMDPHGLLLTLKPEAQWKAACVLMLLARAGYGQARVIAGVRSLEEQKRLYGHGRTGTELRAAGIAATYAAPEMPKVTWCRPEDSDHVRGMAIDIDLSRYFELKVEVAACICEVLHCEWGGFWQVVDRSHWGFARGSNVDATGHGSEVIYG